MWWTRNHMFISKICEKFTSFIFWNFEISFLSVTKFIANFTNKHVITSTNVFVEILRNSQENTSARDSFLLKLQALSLQLYYKESMAEVFSCKFCKISKNIVFYRTPPVAGSLQHAIEGIINMAKSITISSKKNFFIVSSNINEVIKAVLNFLFCFTKRFSTH